MNDIDKNLENVNPEEPKTEAPVEDVSEELVSEETVCEEAMEESAAPTDAVGEILEKIKSLGNLPLIIGAAAAALVLVAVLVVSLLASSPMKLLGTGIGNSAKAILKDDVVSLATDVLTGGSIEVILNTEDILPVAASESTTSIKLYTKANAAALTANIQLDKTETVDLGLLLNQKALVIQSQSLLGETAYGVDLKKAPENYMTSEFGPDGEYFLGFEMDEETKKEMADAEKLAKDTLKISEDAIAAILKAIRGNADISKKADEVSLGDKDVKTTAITLEMDHEQLFEACKEVMKYVHTDKALKKYISENIGTILTMSGEAVDEDTNLQDYVDMIYEKLDDIMDEIDALAELLEDADASIKLTFYVTKSGKQLIGVEFRVEAEGETIRGYVYAGPDLADLQEISFRLNVDDDTFHGSYSIKTDDRKAFEAKLKLVSPDGNCTGKLFWDKKEGNFELVFDENDGRWVTTFEGIMEQSGKKTIINLASIDYDGDKEAVSIGLVIASSDKMPATPKYTDVLTMRADDFEDLAADIQSNYEVAVPRDIRLYLYSRYYLPLAGKLNRAQMNFSYYF